MKTACVIQGNIRIGFELVLKEIQNHFDVVIVSTWLDEKDNLVSGNYYKILNEKPISPGYSNRNLQRLSTYNGIKLARNLGCDYVLKWRTDMLPTNLNLKELIKMSNSNVMSGMKSRLVTIAFRNLSCIDDWYSSIPDLFSFGHIETMELLWSDDNFDYTKMFNPPDQMLLEDNFLMQNLDKIEKIWCAESELYSIFKSRLNKLFLHDFNHGQIAKGFMRLIDHDNLKIVWFGNNERFRSILQASEHPWWTEKTWKGKSKIRLVKKGYLVNKYNLFFKKYVNFIINHIEITKQKEYLKLYLYDSKKNF